MTKRIVFDNLKHSLLSRIVELSGIILPLVEEMYLF